MEIEKLINDIDTINNDIHELNQTIAVELNGLNNRKATLQAELDDHILKSSDFSGKEYGCGTVNIDTEHFKIKTVVSKKIKWDEKALRTVANQIKDAGQDPEAFIKYKLSVSETSYKGFPDAIQQAFLPARSVEPSAPKITIERKDV